jgi:hypothetical protein
LSCQDQRQHRATRTSAHNAAGCLSGIHDLVVILRGLRQE